MINKLLGLFSGKEDDKKNEHTGQPLSPAIDFAKYVQLNQNVLRLEDYKDELQELPDNFFESYPEIESLDIHISSLTSIPPSINSLHHLKNLHIADGKFRTLPDISNLNSLEYFSISRNNLIDLNKELVKLGQLPRLNKITIGSYRGNTFPKNITLLKNCTEVKLGYGLQKKINLSELYDTLVQMPWLKKLNVDFYIQPEHFKDDFLKLDFLEEIILRYYGASTTVPVFFGLLRRANFEDKNPINDILKPFRAKYDQYNLSDRLRKLLFSYYVKNFTELKELLPNLLSKALEQKESVGIVLESKLKGLTQKAIAEKLSSTSIYIAKNGEKGKLVYVVGVDTEFEVIEKLVINDEKIVFQEDLQELLVKLDDPWLLQKENVGLNDQLLQLLASNQIDNYKVAFEIIQGGGANKTIQSLLAAIMLSHPDKVIVKSAERLYDKYGSALYKEYCKKNSAQSLRRSGSTDRKVSVMAKHPDIDEFVFRVMHHVIAANNPNIKDVSLHVFKAKESDISIIPEVFRFFDNIKTLDFSSCSGLNLASSIPVLVQMSSLKELWLNGSHILIPAEIKELVQLEVLEADYNEFADVSALSSLVNLKQLNVEGCKMKTFEWLANLQNLTVLNLNNNGLSQIPHEVYKLSALNTIGIKQNKLSGMDSNLLNLPNLKHVDYSNNAIVNLDYSYFGATLETLYLRSNKIDNFDWEKMEDLGITRVSIKRLNLAANKLQLFSLGSISCPNLDYLDISNNNITKLDPSIFDCPLTELYASKNKISDIPDEVALRSRYNRIWLQDNQIKELKESFSRIFIDNCDLSNNQIEKVHPNFKIKRERDYSRLYWKIRNNPVSKELNGECGLYGHR